MVDFLKKLKDNFFKYWILPWGACYFMVFPVYADDNVIAIEQTGNNLNLNITQVGYGNTVEMLDGDSYINASSLNFQIVQYNFANGENQIIIDEVSGTGNTIKFGQGVAWQSDGSYTYDGSEGAGHYIEMDLYGNDNAITWHQTNQGSTTGHEFNLHLAGSDNTVHGRQQGNGGKELNLTIYNSDNDVTLRQKGTWAEHTANITLDGIYGTDLILRQMGSTTQSYSLSIDCMTVGGCSATVEQGN